MSASWNDNRAFPKGFAIAAIGIVAVFIVALVGFAFLHPAGYSGLYPWFPFGFFWIWPFGFILFFLFAKSFFWGWGWRSGYWADDGDSERILAVRYARGEITKEQFERVRKDLQKQGSS